MNLIFEKFHGLGNDYLVYDCIKNNVFLGEEDIKHICHRNCGIGSDGILIGPIFEEGMIKVKIYNPDGSEAEKSGNGVRIFSRYLQEEGYIKEKSFILKTLGGNVSVEFLEGDDRNIKIGMGKVSFNSNIIGVIGEQREVIKEKFVFNNKEYICTCVSIGNPHCVIPMESISKEKVIEIGKHSEGAKYFPNKINTQIAKVIDKNTIQIEIFERGAGYTLASGSSSCAAATALYKLGLIDNKVTVNMPGGKLFINITDDFYVYMIGEVKKVGSVIMNEDFLKKF